MDSNNNKLCDSIWKYAFELSKITIIIMNMSVLFIMSNSTPLDFCLHYWQMIFWRTYLYTFIYINTFIYIYIHIRSSYLRNDGWKQHSQVYRPPRITECVLFWGYHEGTSAKMMRHELQMLPVEHREKADESPNYTGRLEETYTTLYTLQLAGGKGMDWTRWDSGMPPTCIKTIGGPQDN